jgi:hypothetical protein
MQHPQSAVPAHNTNRITKLWSAVALTAIVALSGCTPDIPRNSRFKPAAPTSPASPKIPDAPKPVLTTSITDPVTGKPDRSAYRQNQRTVALEESQLAFLALDIQNTLGSVEVEVDPRRSDILVQWRAFASSTATPTMPRPVIVNGANDSADPDQPAGWIATDLADDNGLPVFRVLSGAPEGELAAMRIRIVVPSCAGLRIRNSGGAVTATGVSGAIDVRTGQDGMPGGDITIRAAAPQEDPVTVLATQGNVLVTLSRESKGQIRATSGNGGVVAIQAPGSSLRATKVARDNYVGTLGGDNTIELHSANGSVTLAIP